MIDLVIDSELLWKTRTVFWGCGEGFVVRGVALPNFFFCKWGFVKGVIGDRWKRYSLNICCIT